MRWKYKVGFGKQQDSSKIALVVFAMIQKRLKYKELISQFPNCPSENYTEVERDAFRWIHKQITEDDFLPLNIIKTPPQRMLDDSDKLCMGYGLSMFDCFENALSRYKKIFLKLREIQKVQFVSDKGDSIAMVELKHVDGLADHPNKEGHFTFHEYEAVNLKNSVKNIFNIFESNGKFIN